MCAHTQTHIQLKINQKPQHQTKYMNLKEKKVVRCSLELIGTGEGFLNRTQTLRSQGDHWDLMKMRKFCTANNELHLIEMLVKGVL